MLDLDDEKSRKSGRDPLLIELVGLLLLDTVVAGEVKTLAVVGLQVRIGRLGAEAFEVGGEVTMKDRDRVARFGMLVESGRHEHIRSKVHGAAPEFGKQFDRILMCRTYFVSLGGGNRRDLLVSAIVMLAGRIATLIFCGG